MTDVYVTEQHPYYQVWVDGSIYDQFVAGSGHPLTWSQQWDIAAGYREWFTPADPPTEPADPGSHSPHE